MRSALILIVVVLFDVACNGQTKLNKMENQSNNPLLCDIETGTCQMQATDSSKQNETIKTAEKPIKVIYYTDPICSSCWGIEPQLRKFKLEYGNYVEIEYRMGGLLPDWSYNSGGISKPSDVAHHWDEVSVHYDIPIDGDVWLEDPLSSSYPPSIAFKAAQLQDEEKAIHFLRVIREMLFLQKKNIVKWENISSAAQRVGLNIDQLKEDYEGKAREFFSMDLELAKKLGVRGFPTMFFVNSSGIQEVVYGSKPYGTYEIAISKLLASVTKQAYQNDWKSLFSIFPTLTAREFSELSGMPRKDVDAYLQKLYKAGRLGKLETKNGALWNIK